VKEPQPGTRLVHLHNEQPCLLDRCVRPCDRQDPQDSLSPLKLVRSPDEGSRASMTEEDEDVAAVARFHTRMLTPRLNRDIIGAQEQLAKAIGYIESKEYGLAASELTNLLTVVGQCIASSAALSGMKNLGANDKELRTWEDEYRLKDEDGT
jgi:hypothetical protein